MDTSWKSNEPAPEAAQTPPAGKEKRYLGSARRYKALALVLAFVATLLVLLGASHYSSIRNMLRSENGAYLGGSAMMGDMWDITLELQQYLDFVEQNPQELSQRTAMAAWLARRPVPMEYLLLEDGEWKGNGTLEGIRSLPVYATLFSDHMAIFHHAYRGDASAQQQSAEDAAYAARSGAQVVAYAALTQEYIDGQTAYFAAEYGIAMRGIALLSGGLLLLLACAAYLMVSAGRRPGEADVALAWWDWLYLDVQLLAALLLCIGGCYWLVRVGPQFAGFSLIAVAIAACAYLMVLLCLGVLTSISRRIKRREFWRHTLIAAVLRGAWRACKRGGRAVCNVLRALAPSVLQGLLLAAFCLGLLLLFVCRANFFTLLLLGAMVAAVVIYLYTERRIAGGVKRMREGALESRVEPPRLCSALQRGMIEDINHLAEGMRHAVAEQVKAQSMRTELITNVSHDLKTPLTSILAYVELLRQAGLEPPAGEYVEVLAQKSERLRKLTEDLFEAAKAASGSIPVRLEQVDICELIQQGLAELDDRIAKSGLDWRTDLPEPPLYAVADGRLLWRVLENLCSNAIKYAMPGSRVYLDAGRAGGYVAVTMKNISREALNIPAEQLTERFVRGDSARSTEGSGLGLSIAKNLAELMGGRFAIAIDGDLFKATVEIPAWEGE